MTHRKTEVNKDDTNWQMLMNWNENYDNAYILEGDLEYLKEILYMTNKRIIH